MKALKVIGIVTLGAAAGMVVANVLTNGAVGEAVSGVIDSMKEKFMDKGQQVVETVADVTDGIADIADSVTEGI